MSKLVLLLCSAIYAQDVSQGFQHFYNLEFPQALALFEQESAANPNAPEPYNHIAQTLLYAELYRDGALESELVSGANPFLRRPGLNPSAADQKRFAESTRKAIELCEARLRSDPKDKPALYAMGAAYGTKGSYEFLVTKSYSDALKDTNKARKYHQRLTDLDKDFVDAYLLQGLDDYILGSLPRGVRWLSFLAGAHGDKARGIELMRKVQIYGTTTRIDAEILLAATYRREKRFAEAVAMLGVLSDRFPRNYLLKLEMVQLYSDLGDKPRAIAELNGIEKLRSSNAPGYGRLTRERVQFARGNLLFWYGDWDEAIDLMKSATGGINNLDLNSGVLAWMRLGQLNDLKGRRDQAISAYKSAIAYAPNSDAAKESKRYISSPYRRVSHL